MSGSEAKWSFAQKFYVDFNVTVSELASRLDALKGGSEVPPETIQAISSDLSRLTRNLSDATGSLPSYDQRQQQLKALEKRVEELRGVSASTPKFSFKRKATKAKSSVEDTSVVVTPTTTKLQSAPVESARALIGSSHRYLTRLDVPSASPSAEVSIFDLRHCIVNLLPGGEDRAEITALHVQRVSGSVILLPHVSGSIILHDLTECVVVVGCHQFRMHNSTAVDVYLESGSDPVIEHCGGIRFAPYPSSLVREGTLRHSEHFAVKDFSHILPTPSPNWGLLPVEKREGSWPVVVLCDQPLREERERILSALSRPSEHGLLK